MAEKYICIHGHFYQPPRENPWLEEVEFEESALPYHDWNDKINAECYAPNTASRIMDSQQRIIGVVNNYTKISFNFGPTLLYWLSSHDPETYQAILNADKESAKNFSGHGSAIAQVYNHMIMPLANRRDKETQVRWGIRDFEKRFGRYPLGIWLPETAVNTDTLEVLAENNIKFTILAPHQAAAVRKIGEKDWVDVQESKIDPRKAYLCPLPSGKTIALFFFDKYKASEAAFGDLLSNGEVFANRLIDGFKDESSGSKALLTNLASDGELYGHHRPHGDMTLAYCLYYIQSKKLAKITNYSEFLEKYPPEFEVKINESTSWSCSHGIERWKSDCGDNTGTHIGWKQAWRKPLREAMDWLRDELAPKFEAEAAKLLKEPWLARNDYIEVVLDRSKETIDRFLDAHKSRDLSGDDKKRVLRLLEMQRQAMLMFTSCGWFFDEISGIEAVQVMRYAARAMQLAKQVFGVDLEGKYIRVLETAPSNIVEFGNGAETYRRLVETAFVDLAKIAAQGTILQLFSKDVITSSSSPLEYGCCFKVTSQEFDRREVGKFRLVTNYSIVESGITLDGASFACVAVWFGDHNVSCWVKQENDKIPFESATKEITAAFDKAEINGVLQLIPKYFGSDNYSLRDLFKDDQKRILEIIVGEALKNATKLNEMIYRDNFALLRFMSEIRVKFPTAFQKATEIALNAQIRHVLAFEEVDIEALNRLIQEAKSLPVDFEPDLIVLQANNRITREFIKLSLTPLDVKKIEDLDRLIVALGELHLTLDLWHAQNIAFELARKYYKHQKSEKTEEAQKWVTAFSNLCRSIGIGLE